MIRERIASCRRAIAAEAAKNYTPGLSQNHDPSFLKAVREAYAEGYFAGIYLGAAKQNHTEDDSERLDWLESKMRPAEGYCEIYIAGLRSGVAPASAFQVEANPEIFRTAISNTLRDAIDLARSEIFGRKPANTEPTGRHGGGPVR